MTTTTSHCNEACAIAQNIYNQIEAKLLKRREDLEFEGFPELCEAKEIVFEFRYYKDWYWRTGQVRRIIHIEALSNAGYLAYIKLCTTELSYAEEEDATKVSKPFFRHILECLKNKTPNILPSRRQLAIDEILADLE